MESGDVKHEGLHRKPYSYRVFQTMTPASVSGWALNRQFINGQGFP